MFAWTVLNLARPINLPQSIDLAVEYYLFWKLLRCKLHSEVVEFFFYFFIASKTHTEKKQKLHRINKVIKTKNKKKIANLHTYMAIYLQILKYVTAVLIPYITVLSMIYN